MTIIHATHASPKIRPGLRNTLDDLNFATTMAFLLSRWGAVTVLDLEVIGIVENSVNESLLHDSAFA